MKCVPSVAGVVGGEVSMFDDFPIDLRPGEVTRAAAFGIPCRGRPRLVVLFHCECPDPESAEYLVRRAERRAVARDPSLAVLCIRWQDGASVDDVRARLRPDVLSAVFEKTAEFTPRPSVEEGGRERSQGPCASDDDAERSAAPVVPGASAGRVEFRAVVVHVNPPGATGAQRSDSGGGTVGGE